MKKKIVGKKTISLSACLIVIVTVTVAAGAIGCSLAFASMLRSTLVDMAVTTSQQSVSQAAKTIETYSENIKTDMENIAEKINQKQDVKMYMNAMAEINNDITSVMIYDEEGTILEYGNNGSELKPDLSKNLSFDKELFYRELVLENKNYCITAPHVQNIFEKSYPWVVTVAKRMWYQKYEKNVYVVVDTRFSSVASYIDNMGVGSHGYCYLIDNSGKIVYHPQQQLLFSNIKKEATNWINEIVNGVHVEKDTIYVIKNMGEWPWRIVSVSYTDDLIGKRVTDALHAVSVITIVCVAIAMILIAIFSGIISRPIRSLINAMRGFEKDATGFKYNSVHGIREINMLSQSFGDMVLKIQQLMEQVKHEEITLRKTELKALQAQINPHFLYNTLDSILWMCEQERMQDAVKMVSALARLFRISISHGNELITIENEIHHAKSYLVIQSYRYKNQFTYRFDIDKNILKYLCNKITLQPIIENAIYHGISRNIDEGEILISAKGCGDDIIFTVKDNGVGMTEEQCNAILKKERSDSSGIGIKNVNDRIKIYFGEKYGITIESVIDSGTTITIVFPKVEENIYEGK